MNRQLFLATLTFAVLLFLLPTILVYYVVFATVSHALSRKSVSQTQRIISRQLRFAIYCVSFTLMTVRRMILQFPFDGMIRWLRRTYTNLDSMEIYNIGSYSKENITIIYIAPRSSSFWGSWTWSNQRTTATSPEGDVDGGGGKEQVLRPMAKGTISIGQFFASLVRGEMVPFIQPDESVHLKVE